MQTVADSLIRGSFRPRIEVTGVPRYHRHAQILSKMGSIDQTVVFDVRRSRNTRLGQTGGTLRCHRYDDFEMLVKPGATASDVRHCRSCCDKVDCARESAMVNGRSDGDSPDYGRGWWRKRRRK